MKKLFKTKIRIRLFFLILISLIGTLWQWNMQKIELTRYTPIGTYINVGIFNAHCYTKGEGNIVFVFIAGSGTPCAFTDFYCLQNVLSAYGKTISFDHAGLGWSSEADHKQDIDNLAENLSVILDSMTLKDNTVYLESAEFYCPGMVKISVIKDFLKPYRKLIRLCIISIWELT